MIEKVDRVLDLLTAALTLYLGQPALPLAASTAVEKKDRKPRATKAEMAARAPEAPADESPFGNLGETAPARPKGALVTPSVEETVEAARRMKELLGVYIRKHAPVSKGQENAKALIASVIPQEVGKNMEQFSYISNLKFAEALEKALA